MNKDTVLKSLLERHPPFIMTPDLHMLAVLKELVIDGLAVRASELGIDCLNASYTFIANDAQYIAKAREYLTTKVGQLADKEWR